MGEGADQQALDGLTPREVVSALDRYIVGQNDAKRAVAVALRNRWRRQRVGDGLREEITPKNIIMIGPTGVGKTEIARRLSRQARAPFVKVEASKFTEVGYVGRDVESMIRDLMEVAIKMVSEEQRERVQTRARERAEERILELLLPSRTRQPYEEQGTDDEAAASAPSTRDKLKKLLDEGYLDDREVELEVEDSSMPMMDVFSNSGMEEMGIQLKDSIGHLFPKKKKTRRITVKDALKILEEEEGGKLVDQDAVVQESLTRVQESGIVFLDEIDKVAGRQTSSHGPDVSREGVQRDLLPVVEGCSVSTKHGMIRTDHILFIAAGAFHIASVSDLIPELQGRFPIRVELDSLTREDFVRILTEPENALTRQYTALLGTEGLEVSFTADGVEAIADVACRVNDTQENIGARRLHTVMERLLETESFDASERPGDSVVVDQAFVQDRLADVLEDPDLSQYIL
ncbi:MAG: ATP-dependent protease ATPase subunit HslU [Myxococcota bacterium]|nr:ATP-dependent protease ATPase subunit HslU [Myxococcota bacterium]